MKLDFKHISGITGIPAKALESRFADWQNSGKRTKSNVDFKLIAALSGVSVSSVSNYFNKKQGSMSPEKASILDKLVSYLDYIPSNAAKKLRSNKKMSIGYIAPLSNSSSAEYYIEILKGIKEEANKLGYSVDVYDIDEEHEKKYYANLPFIGMVDGIIIVSSSIGADALLPLKQKRIPVFHINPRIEDTRPPFVGSVISETAPFADLCKHLFGYHMYRNPVLLSIEINSFSQREEKYQIFKDSMAEYHLPFDPEKNVVFLQSYSYTEGQRGYLESCEKNPDADVYVCLSDTIAASILRAVENSGSKAGVTGYADFEIAKVFDLTTINQDIQSLGVKAFQKIYYAMMYNQRNGEFPDHSTDTIPVQYVQRSSCGCNGDHIQEK